MGILIGIVSILISVFIGLFFRRTVKTITGDIDAVTDLTTLHTPDKVDIAFFLQKLDTYIDSVRTGNIRRLHSIMSDSMYHLTESDAQARARLGIRREIEYAPAGFIAPSPIMHDGKVSWSSVQFPVKYTERIIDNQTNQPLHTIHHDKADIVMTITRSDSRAPGEVLSCIGCGQPVDTSGELFICPYCKATYTADSYAWSISAYAVLSEKSQEKSVIGRLTVVTMIMMIVLPILGFISQAVPFLRWVVIIVNILMLGMILYWGLWMVPNAFRGVFHMRKIDRLFSMSKFFSRVEYLMSIFFSATNYNPNNLKPFMDQYVFAEMMQNFQHTGNYVLRVDMHGQGKTSAIKRHGGRHYMTLSINTDVVLLDSYRRVHELKKRISFQVCRAESAMTTLKSNFDILECPGCGRSINLTANGKCKYCGAGYDLSQIDWILGRIDKSMFM